MGWVIECHWRRQRGRTTTTATAAANSWVTWKWFSIIVSNNGTRSWGRYKQQGIAITSTVTRLRPPFFPCTPNFLSSPSFYTSSVCSTPFATHPHSTWSPTPWPRSWQSSASKHISSIFKTDSSGVRPSYAGGHVAAVVDLADSSVAASCPTCCACSPPSLCCCLCSPPSCRPGPS